MCPCARRLDPPMRHFHFPGSPNSATLAARIIVFWHLGPQADAQRGGSGWEGPRAGAVIRADQ